MDNKKLYLDAKSNKVYKYFSDCLNLFIPTFLDHDLYPFNGTQLVSTKDITDKNNNIYKIWQLLKD